MSIATWKNEFYSEVYDATGDDVAALEHAIKKWRGLTPENLSRHGLKQYYATIEDFEGNTFYVDTSTCALCQMYWNPSRCKDCPLVKTSGLDSCDGGLHSPYKEFKLNCNPIPMIELLERALSEATEQVSETPSVMA